MISLPGVSTANQALTLVGSITDLVKKGATLELQQAIVTLKEAVLGLKEENLELREKVAALEGEVARKAKLVFDSPNYYVLSEDGSSDGPFCQVCHDTKNIIVRLKEIERGSWNCGGCLQYFETKAYREQANAAVEANNRLLDDHSWMR